MAQDSSGENARKKPMSGPVWQRGIVCVGSPAAAPYSLVNSLLISVNIAI